jgi:hypothetical protein
MEVFVKKKYEFCIMAIYSVQYSILEALSKRQRYQYPLYLSSEIFVEASI